MPTYDQHTAGCRVFSFKEGLLSAVAHDLRLRVERFAVDLSDDMSRVSATFDPRSIRVEGAVIDGYLDEQVLSSRDKAKIEKNIVTDVIAVKKWPQIRFASSSITATDGGWRVIGELELAGKRRSITVQARRDGDHIVADVPLHQPNFGIKPFTAMLGTLKIKPGVRVSLRVPVPEGM